eukprot:2581264-Alexandrium_andersonii.AAC.1
MGAAGRPQSMGAAGKGVPAAGAVAEARRSVGRVGMVERHVVEPRGAPGLPQPCAVGTPHGLGNELVAAAAAYCLADCPPSPVRSQPP